MLNFNLIKQWYSRSDVKFNIITFLYNREFALLVPSWIKDKDVLARSIRTLRAHNVQGFDYIIKQGIRMFDDDKQTPYNIYYSLARYVNGIPMQTFNFSKRDNTEWNKTNQSQIVSYDFLIDIDAGEHEDIMFAHESARMISDYFDVLNVPYELRFSGKGFHIIVPYEYFANLKLSFLPKEKENIYKLYARIAIFLKDKFSEMLDTNIYDSRRVCKIPYSLALYEDSIYICTPFQSKKDFTEFKKGDCILKEIPDCLSLRDRKTKVFNSNGNIYQLLKESDTNGK